MTQAIYNDLWGQHFANLTNQAIPDYGQFLISERMFEDYLDIFRGKNTRLIEHENIMPYPHPFFDGQNPKLKEKPYIKYIMIGEARPPQNPSNLNDCGGDTANTYFYNVTHVKSTPWLNAPRINWGCPIFTPCPNNKIETLLCLASKGVLLIDLYPFAIYFTPQIRAQFVMSGVTASFWNDPFNPYNLQTRLNVISNLLCPNWDLAMVAPCNTSGPILNDPITFPTINVIGNPGIHPANFRDILFNVTRCNANNPILGYSNWRKIAVAQQGPSAGLLAHAF
jgi:hypothetical protein